MPGIAQLTAKEEEAVYHVIKGPRSTLDLLLYLLVLHTNL